MSTLRNHRRGVVGTALVGTAAGALLAASPAGAAATSTNPVVTDRETVQVQLTPTGKVDVARLFGQLTVSGNGHYVISDPTSSKAWRNLDGFATPTFKDGNAVWTIDVHGKTVRRSVSEVSSSTLPVTIAATYTLDGKPMKPSDLVGKSGTLGVTWTIKNITATPTPISFTDGHGKPVTKTVDLVTPYVGQLSTVLPESFKQIDAARADLAGDGHGGTQAVWTMVLFSPIGETTQTFGYTAKVKNMTLPAATVQVVPVPPQRKPELKFGQDGFAEGAATGASLTDGATQIDSNLIKLRDGAGQLLSGLTQLADGATKLQTGLAGQAAPGAKALAAGTSTALSGANQLSAGLITAQAGSIRLADGTDALAAGANKLATGLSAASAGSQQLLTGSQDLAAGAGLVNGGAQQLTGGLALISGGLAALNDATTGLPAAKAGAIALQAGVAALQTGVTAALGGVGAAGTPGTLLDGMAQISGGLGQLASPTLGLPAAKGGVDQVKAGLDAALVPTSGSIDQLALGIGGVSAINSGVIAGLGCPGSALPVCPSLATEAGILSQLTAGVSDPTTGLKAQTQAASGALGLVSGGLGSAILGVAALQGGATLVTNGLNALKLGLSNPSDPAHPGLAQGLGLVSGGLTQLVAGLTAAVAGVAQLAPGAAVALSGAQQVAGGTQSLANGAGDLAAGAAQLADGASQLDAGGKQLATGAGQAASGASQLSAGTTKLSTGGQQLAAGLKKINSGAGELSGGLGSAATGSEQLAAGLKAAQSGGKQIADGTGQLQSQGTSQLVKAGEDTTMSFGEKLAQMKALDAKAADGALPYGAPAGATGSAAYSYTLAAETTESKDSLVRAVLAVVLLGLTGGIATVLRRRVVAG